MKYTIYTDGAASGNGSENCVCGWAYVVVGEDGQIYGEDSGAIHNGTNNIGELTGIIQALYAAKFLEDNHKRVIICSDSAYCINGITSWRFIWRKNDWWRDSKKTQELKNRELWIELDSLIDSDYMDFEKVKGHTGNKDWNDYVDKLAVEAVRREKECLKMN